MALKSGIPDMSLVCEEYRVESKGQRVKSEVTIVGSTAQE